MYPENSVKASWDNLITILLIFTCVITPYRIAFESVDTLGWSITNYTIDFLFLIDIFLNFNTAFYDDDFGIIEDRWTISKQYLTGWFVIDVLAIFPFDLIANTQQRVDHASSSAQVNEMVRLTRLGRMYKIIKLLRLVRVIKLQKKGEKSVKGDAHEQARLDQAFKRILLFIFNFALCTHIFACIWIITGQIDEGNPDSWMAGDIAKLDESGQYLTAFYFTITTITTVGYGDFSPGTFIEKIVGIVIMFVGVMAFSFASGSLASYISQKDNHSAIYAEKMAILDRLFNENEIPIELFSKVKKNLRYNFMQDTMKVN